MSSPKWEAKVSLRLETSLSNTPKSGIKKKRKNQSAPPTGSRNKTKQVLASFAKSSFLSDTNSSAAQTKTRRLCPNKSHLLSEHKTEQCLCGCEHHHHHPSQSHHHSSITSNGPNFFQIGMRIWCKFVPPTYLPTYLTYPFVSPLTNLQMWTFSHNMQLFLMQVKDPRTPSKRLN
jgi:hypothetical protein